MLDFVYMSLPEVGALQPFSFWFVDFFLEVFLYQVQDNVRQDIIEIMILEIPSVSNLELQQVSKCWCEWLNNNLKTIKLDHLL